MKKTDREILGIALPAIVSNITVPLLGLVDVAIVGHLGDAAYIGAIAVGGMLFNIIYWIFGFLRMGTSGMTAQLYGKQSLTEIVQMLVRAATIGTGIALVLIALQVPIREAAFLIIRPTEAVGRLATTYFHICIWGAPAMLGLYGLTGWYIGMQNSRIPMLIAITQNVVNIAASLCLVYLCGMKVEGVALGTLIAQYAGLLMGIVLWMRHYGYLWASFRREGLFRRSVMKRFFEVNRDIFLRTLCLVAVTLFFTSAGAGQGEIILAVNTLLMQLFTLYSYIMDGHNDKYPKDYLGFERFLENYTFERGVESREITLKVVAAEKADTERKATISIRNLPGRQPAYTLLDKEVTIAPKKKSAHVRIRIYPAKIKKADEIRLTCTPKDKKVKMVQMEKMERMEQMLLL